MNETLLTYPKSLTFVTQLSVIVSDDCGLQLLPEGRPLDNNDFSYSITNKITIAQIY